MKFAPLSTALTLAALLAWMTPHLSAEDKPSLDGLPAAVQKTAREHVGTSKIDEVEDTFEEGKHATEVEYEKDGVEMAVVIADDGKLIQVEHRISIGDTPENIKKSVEKLYPSGKISKIKKIDKSGKTLFQVALMSDGKAHKFMLDEEGHPSKSGEEK